MLIYEKIVDGIFLIYSDSKFWYKCRGILIRNENIGNILIDCNCYYPKEIQTLVRNPIEAYFVSHVHLDHTFNLHYYEELVPNIKIHCPIPEIDYLKDFNKFIKDNGTLDYGIGEEFKMFAFKELKFKEVKSAIGFNPGAEFEFKSANLKLKTIPIPGHSPAQTAFSIEDTTGKRRKILFVADIGLGQMGAYYGFSYGNLNDVRESVKRIEDIYLNDDYIVTSSHGPIFFKKIPALFDNILITMEEKERDILNMLDSNNPKGLKDLILKGLFFDETVTKLLSVDRKFSVQFFEHNMIMKHIKELLEQEKIIDVGNNQWILNK